MVDICFQAPVRIVTINKGIAWGRPSWAQKTNKNAAHVDPREVVRARIRSRIRQEPGQGSLRKDQMTSQGMEKGSSI